LDVQPTYAGPYPVDQWASRILGSSALLRPLSATLDDDGDFTDLRLSECSVQPAPPVRRTPEVTYLCANHRSSVSYREAARNVADLIGLPTPSRATVRKVTVGCREYVIRDPRRH